MALDRIASEAQKEPVTSREWMDGRLEDDRRLHSELDAIKERLDKLETVTVLGK